MSCELSDTTEPNQQMQMPISFRIDSFQSQYDISRIKATLLRDDWSNSLNLSILDNIASGTFSGLYPGIYILQVEMFTLNPFDETELMIAYGETEVEIVVGETTEVNLTLEEVDATGTLEIIIDWETQENIENILWIGNSYTYANGGVDEIVYQLYQAENPDTNLNTNHYALGGATLEQHWHNQATLDIISETDWDYVFLQEQSLRPIEDPQLMYTYADSLAQFIQSQDSESGFFMTWARENQPEMIDDLAAAYNHCGEITNSMVVAVGRAFDTVQNENWQNSLYSADGSHPNTYGTYLVGCVFYSYIFQQSPVSNPFISEEMSLQEAQFLQETAWQTYIEYNND